MLLRHYAKRPVASVYSVEQDAEPQMKPNGFWVSVDDCGDNWKAWCEAEDFGRDRLVVLHGIDLAPNANILRLSSASEIDALTKRYAEIEPRWKAAYRVRWQEIATRYDGIIIAPYIWTRRLEGGSDWYYGWDCASGCIWNANAIASIQVLETGKHTPAEEKPDAE